MENRKKSSKIYFLEASSLSGATGGLGGLEVAAGRFLVERLRVALDDPDCVLGAGAEARAETVAVDLGDQSRLAVDDLDRPLGTCGHALAAAVALRLVDLHDFSLRHWDLPSLQVDRRVLRSGGVSKMVGPGESALPGMIAEAAARVLDLRQPAQRNAAALAKGHRCDQLATAQDFSAGARLI